MSVWTSSARQMPAEQHAFAAALLDGSLPAEQFDHVGHLRAAWYFISLHGPARGAGLCAGAIRAYATALGAAGKYHHTLTMALLQLVAVELEAASWPDWEGFRAGDHALFGDVRALLARYYSPALLYSEQARQRFLPPDREQLPDSPLFRE